MTFVILSDEDADELASLKSRLAVNFPPVSPARLFLGVTLMSNVTSDSKACCRDEESPTSLNVPS
eukprot:559763-Prymnesium_polylepis.1